MKSNAIRWLLALLLGAAILAALGALAEGQRRANALRAQAIELERQRDLRERTQNVLDSL